MTIQTLSRQYNPPERGLSGATLCTVQLTEPTIKNWRPAKQPSLSTSNTATPSSPRFRDGFTHR